MQKIKFLLPALVVSILVGSTQLWAQPLTEKEQQYRQIAQTLLEGYPDADPMVLDHARQLVAGEPVKKWKNCRMKNELERAEQKASAQSALSFE